MLNFKPCFCQKEWGSCQHFPKTVLEAKGPNKLKKAQQSAWKAGLNMWSSWTKWRECWQAMRLLQATWKSCSRDAHCRTQLLGSFWLERATEAAPVQSDKTGSPQITELSLKNQKHTRAECFFPVRGRMFHVASCGTARCNVWHRERIFLVGSGPCKGREGTNCRCSLCSLKTTWGFEILLAQTSPGGNLEALRFKWLEFMHPRLLDPRDLHLGKAIARQDSQTEES